MSRRTSHRILPIVTTSRIAGAVEARASKARAAGPMVARAGIPTWTRRYSSNASARSIDAAMRPSPTACGSKRRSGSPKCDPRPPASSMSSVSTFSPRRRAARALAAATADLPTPPLPETRSSRVTFLVGLERDAKDEVALFDRPAGVGYEGEVGVVGLLLIQELLPLRAGDRRQRALLHRLGPRFVTGDHRVYVKLSHC